MAALNELAFRLGYRAAVDEKVEGGYNAQRHTPFEDMAFRKAADNAVFHETTAGGMSRTEAWTFLRDQAPYAISGGQGAIYALEPLMVEVLGVEVTDPRVPPMEFNYFNQDVPEVHSGNMLSGCEDTKDMAPEANAPSPEIMRLELINIIVAKSGGKVARFKAEAMVDAILEKQMVYYASMADPEVTTDEAARVQAVIEAKAMIEALIRQGGVVCEFMADRGLWQRTAARARETVEKLTALIT